MVGDGILEWPEMTVRFLTGTSRDTNHHDVIIIEKDRSVMSSDELPEFHKEIVVS